MNADVWLRRLGLELGGVEAGNQVCVDKQFFGNRTPHFFKKSSNVAKAGLGSGLPYSGAFTFRRLTLFTKVEDLSELCRWSETLSRCREKRPRGFFRCGRGLVVTKREG